ncbi:acetyl-CoA carboxylase, partial [Trifolium medium]|nr:acetyl-CoA carboxylase [Trifolium medium]
MFTDDCENIDTPKRKSFVNDQMEDLVSCPLAVEDALVGSTSHILSGPILSKRASGLIATREFLEEHVERKNWVEDKTLVEKHSEKKWGLMV